MVYINITMKKQIKLYILEKDLNPKIYEYLKIKYYVTHNLMQADVIIVAKVKEVSIAFDIIDFALSSGKEIICIKGNFSKENYVSSNLIKNGATWI